MDILNYQKGYWGTQFRMRHGHNMIFVFKGIGESLQWVSLSLYIYIIIYIYRNTLFGPTKMGIIISDEQPFVDSTIDDLFGDSTDTSTRG